MKYLILFVLFPLSAFSQAEEQPRYFSANLRPVYTWDNSTFTNENFSFSLAKLTKKGRISEMEFHTLTTKTTHGQFSRIRNSAFGLDYNYYYLFPKNLGLLVPAIGPSTAFIFNEQKYVPFTANYWAFHRRSLTAMLHLNIGAYYHASEKIYLKFFIPVHIFEIGFHNNYFENPNMRRGNRRYIQPELLELSRQTINLGIGIRF